MVEPGERVCPRCGHVADDDAYCPECGFDLRSRALPTWAEWVKARREPPAPPHAAAVPPGAGAPPQDARERATRVSSGTALPIVVLVVGAALAIFGIVRLVVGDSEVGKLEDQRDSLQSQEAALTGDRSAIESSGREADASLKSFIGGVETVAERVEADIDANNRVVEALNASGGSAPAALLQEDRRAGVEVRGAVKRVEKQLGEAREATGGLETSVNKGERGLREAEQGSEG